MSIIDNFKGKGSQIANNASSTADTLGGYLTAINNVIDKANNNSPTSFGVNDNILPSRPSADGNGLPFTKVINQRKAKGFKPNLITWYVPEFGAVKMWINPQTLTVNNTKDINSTRTKGGFTLQYWGEGLTDITLSGTTGSSGIEGINMLYEIYRAEQLAFDGTGLAVAGNNYNSSQAATSLVQNGLDALGNAGTALGGLLGIGQAQDNLIPKNMPSLAQYAFTVEMYYSGIVYRGYFKTMNITESADNFNFQYTITFTATQKRGYRINNFGWQRSPNVANAYPDTGESNSFQRGSR